MSDLEICELDANEIECLRAHVGPVLGRRREDVAAFFKVTRVIWDRDFELLETLLVECATSIRIRTLAAAGDESRLGLVMCHLASRAGTIGFEILCLIEHGFADGAMARWRTLDEISVVAQLVAENGEDAAAAYIASGEVQMRGFYDRLSKAGYNLVELGAGEVVAAAETAYLAIIERHGDWFADRDWSWCKRFVGWSDNKRPLTFNEIRRRTTEVNVSPEVLLANQSVHAGAIGTFRRFSRVPGREALPVLGSTPHGLAAPLANTARSIVQVLASMWASELGEGALTNEQRDEEDWRAAVIFRVMKTLLGSAQRAEEEFAAAVKDHPDVFEWSSGS